MTRDQELFASAARELVRCRNQPMPEKEMRRRARRAAQDLAGVIQRNPPHILYACGLTDDESSQALSFILEYNK